MNSGPWLGVIADDYTGATDLAGMIARTGMTVIQYLGVPDSEVSLDVDCIVVALKSRSTPARQAVSESLAAAKWLRSIGAHQLYFKYCSTFDSTDQGNIGPVADGLAELVDARSVVFCPATPEHKRTTYLGHLFVGDRLLSESPLRDHPINPMTDPDLRRVLSRQTATPVGLLALGGELPQPELIASKGAERIFLIADALTDDDVLALAHTVEDQPLVTGGAALAAKLAEIRGTRGDSGPAPSLSIPQGPAIVLAGSGSAATRRQLERLGEQHPRFTIDPYALDADADAVVAAALAFLDAHRDDLPVVAATSEPAEVRRVQEDLGIEHSARLIEESLGRIARGAVDRGVRRILVAGGESSGAVVNGLGVRALRIGAEVAPGVPWTVSEGAERIGLLLKSGNFGGESVFTDALALADAS